MFKKMYETIVDVYSNETKEELIQRIMSLEAIESIDRYFANRYMAETADNINELFTALEDLQSNFTYEKAAKMYEIMNNAKDNWVYIIAGIKNISDDNRYEKVLNELRTKVSNAKNSNDSI